ncbi:MAG TPA: glycosyltransferase family 4 protein [Candidatus Bathyarchaeia archaeon]|nr:glycosyltransferase family 4 protein [Candidatus Bathyarchaeia archaeon]
MRILFLTSAFEAVAGYWRAFNLGMPLASRGHDITLVCQSKSPSLHASRRVVAGVKILSLPSLISVSSNSLLETAARASTLITQTCLNLWTTSLDFDVIHVYDAAFPQNAIPAMFCRVKRRSKRPALFVDWDDWMGRGGSLNLFHGEGANNMVIPLLTFLEEKTPLYADMITVTTEVLRQRALQVGVNKKDIVMLPNGANTDAIGPKDMRKAREELGLPADVMIYICNKSTFFVPLRPGDPILDLLLAHKSALKEHPSAILFLLGKGSEKCIPWIKSLGIEKNVRCVGWQPLSMLSLYFGASNFLVLPIRDTIFDRARFPLRLADYMAAGRPIVATALPEIERVTRGFSWLAKPNDSADLADKLVQAMRQPMDLWRKMGQMAREKAVKHLSWTVLSEQLEKTYLKYNSLS